MFSGRCSGGNKGTEVIVKVGDRERRIGREEFGCRFEGCSVPSKPPSDAGERGHTLAHPISLCLGLFHGKIGSSRSLV